MKYALIIWLVGGQIWLDADPMTKAECAAVVASVLANGITYVADDKPPIERLGCFLIREA